MNSGSTHFLPVELPRQIPRFTPAYSRALRVSRGPITDRDAAAAAKAGSQAHKGGGAGPETRRSG